MASKNIFFEISELGHFQTFRRIFFGIFGPVKTQKIFSGLGIFLGRGLLDLSA